MFASHMEVLTTDQKGNIAETAIVEHATRLGIAVYRPVGEGGRFDMFFLFPSGRIARVQCKWAQRQGGVVVVRSCSSRRTATGMRRRPYTADEIDAIAAYCAELDRVSTSRSRLSTAAARFISASRSRGIASAAR